MENNFLIKRNLETVRENKKKTLDFLVEEKFAEIFFLAKDEYGITAGSSEEEKLFNLLENFKLKLKNKCEKHFNV